MNELYYDDIKLVLLEYVDDIPNITPYYIYLIIHDHDEVGRLILRTGSKAEHLYDGHIGYTIEPEYRGHHYAYKACEAIKPILAKSYDSVYITCSPDNIASIRTIEKLGCTYIQCLPIPPSLKKYYTKDEIEKRIYNWQLQS